MKKLFISLLVIFSAVNLYSKKTVYDICGNAYSELKIGDQYWLSENMKCDRYDTESEAYAAGIRSVGTSSDIVFTPYFVDATDKSHWDTRFSEDAGDLTDDELSKIGYHYNWAAAVGLQTDADAKRLLPFDGDRQGICPNGWHVPTLDEWDALKKFIEVTDNKGEKSAAKHLKSATGWNTSDAYHLPGLNTYNFTMLPCGGSTADVVRFVGKSTAIWSATTNSEVQTGQCVNVINFINREDDMSYDEYGTKSYAYPVRCIRTGGGEAVNEHSADATTAKAYKQIVDGKIVIVRGGNTYNLIGVKLD